MVRRIPTRRESNEASAQAAAELESRAAVVAGALPDGLEIEWLGVSGYRLAYESSELFVDPYVSRVPLGSLLRGRTALPDPGLIGRWCPPRPRHTVAGVLVGHTHYDDFFVPLADDPEPIANVQLAELPSEIEAVSRDATLASIPRVGTAAPPL